jgi:hypothetical protein
MGSKISKPINYEKNLYIIFDIYPTVNYENSSNNNNNILEKNNRFRQYIKKKIQRLIHKITNIQFDIPENKFIIKCDVDMSNFIIYYKIYITIEFIITKPPVDVTKEQYNPKIVTYNLLRKTIMEKFTLDIENKTNIKIDKTNFIYLDVGAIRNLKLD